MSTRAERKKIRRAQSCAELSIPFGNDGWINQHFKALLAQQKHKK